MKEKAMKPLRMAHEKIRGTRERIVSGLKDYLDGLPQKMEKPRDFDPFGQTGFAHLWLQYD